ncbi:cation channel sperm-associated auxiliary subunit zeta isoform X2 [Pelodiscus sinensis]|uniref:cation channel sperm-associated auxiliary subunit zeta isoform X2 n=1 Tax=Pelodiscus sinensis TaxID=13735 RepID=UPI003F6BA781
MSGKAGEALAGKTDLRRCSGRSLSHDPSNVQEVEVLEQGEQVPDPAEGSSRDTSSPPHEDSERPDSASEEELVPAAKASETSAHLTQLMESRSSLAGRSSSIWTMGNRISHWRLAHQRGYHLDQLTQDKSYRHRVRKHERDCKAATRVPPTTGTPTPSGADGGGGPGNLNRDPERLPAASRGKAPTHSPDGAAHGATEAGAKGQEHWVQRGWSDRFTPLYAQPHDPSRSPAHYSLTPNF